METLTIKVNNSHTIRLLKELEALNLIEVIKEEVVNPSSGVVSNRGKLSDRLAGSSSAEQARIMNQELEQTRHEWRSNS